MNCSSITLATRQSKQIQNKSPGPSLVTVNLPPAHKSNSVSETSYSIPNNQHTPAPPDSLNNVPCIHSPLSQPSLSDSLIDSLFLAPPQIYAMSDQKMAISSHSLITCPPQLSGKISPKAVKDFENHCLNYFVNAKGGIDDNLKMSRILGCFESDLIKNWISVHCARFTTLSFMEFMVEFRAHWLPHDWEQNIQSKILSTHLYPKKQHFKEWASAIQSLNVSLCGTASHLDDDHICLQLEAGLDEDLQNIAHDAKAHEELSLTLG